MSLISKPNAKHAASRAGAATTGVRSFRLLTAADADSIRESRRSVGEPILQPGDRVVLDGVMSCSREELQAGLLGHGYVPWPWVSRSVKLVVVADLGVSSANADRARLYGIPVIDEARLAELLH